MKLNRRKANKDYQGPYVAHGNIIISNLKDDDKATFHFDYDNRVQGIKVVDPSRYAQLVPCAEANESVTLTTHTGNGKKRERRELRPAKQGGFQQIWKRMASYFRNG